MTYSTWLLDLRFLKLYFSIARKTMFKNLKHFNVSVRALQQCAHQHLRQMFHYCFQPTRARPAHTLRWKRAVDGTLKEDVYRCQNNSGAQRII